MSTPELKIPNRLPDETLEHVHGAHIKSTNYIILKDHNSQPEGKRFKLYEYKPAPTLMDKSTLKPLFDDEDFGTVCFEMFKIGLGL